MFVTNKRFKKFLEEYHGASEDKVKERLNSKILDLEDELRATYSEAKRNNSLQSVSSEVSRINDILAVLKKIRG